MRKCVCIVRSVLKIRTYHIRCQMSHEQDWLRILGPWNLNRGFCDFTKVPQFKSFNILRVPTLLAFHTTKLNNNNQAFLTLTRYYSQSWKNGIIFQSSSKHDYDAEMRPNRVLHCVNYNCSRGGGNWLILPFGQCHDNVNVEGLKHVTGTLTMQNCGTSFGKID